MPSTKSVETRKKPTKNNGDSEPKEKKKKNYTFEPQVRGIYKKTLREYGVTFQKDVWRSLTGQTEQLLEVIASKIPTAVYGSVEKYEQRKKNGKGSKKIKPKHIEKIITFLSFGNCLIENDIKKKMIEGGNRAVLKLKAKYAEDKPSPRTSKASDTQPQSKEKKRKVEKSSDEDFMIEQTQNDE